MERKREKDDSDHSGEKGEGQQERRGQETKHRTACMHHTRAALVFDIRTWPRLIPRIAISASCCPNRSTSVLPMINWTWAKKNRGTMHGKNKQTNKKTHSTRYSKKLTGTRKSDILMTKTTRQLGEGVGRGMIQGRKQRTCTPPPPPPHPPK